VPSLDSQELVEGSSPDKSSQTLDDLIPDATNGKTVNLEASSHVGIEAAQ
jgi:hypothetical protein